MIKFINNLKSLKDKKLNAGMTYIELIVVLGIFSVMSTIVIYNYGEFQAKVDIKNLASDIALKIVEAQKSSVNGVLPLSYPADWKPSYGVYFGQPRPLTQFIYFKDLDKNGYSASAEILDTILIKKNDVVYEIDVCTGSNCAPINSASTLSITFQRPDSSAIFNGVSVNSSQYIQIVIKSPKTAMATIKVYPSGRIQVN